jgi:hypothetical protein
MLLHRSKRIPKVLFAWSTGCHVEFQRDQYRQGSHVHKTTADVDLYGMTNGVSESDSGYSFTIWKSDFPLVLHAWIEGQNVYLNSLRGGEAMYDAGCAHSSFCQNLSNAIRSSSNGNRYVKITG